jgi:hypothetical protein
VKKRSFTWQPVKQLIVKLVINNMKKLSREPRFQRFSRSITKNGRTSRRTVDPAALADAANWRFWMLDLDTRAASPIDAIGHHAGGFATSRIDGRTFLMVPSADHDSTSVYELALDGAPELRWSVPGWATELPPLR